MRSFSLFTAYGVFIHENKKNNAEVKFYLIYSKKTVLCNSSEAAPLKQSACLPLIEEPGANQGCFQIEQGAFS